MMQAGGIETRMGLILKNNGRRLMITGSDLIQMDIFLRILGSRMMKGIGTG